MLIVLSSCSSIDKPNSKLKSRNNGLWYDEVHNTFCCGKDLIMNVEELERKHNVSIVKVQFTSGASVPSIMFVTKGLYNIAKQRRKNYFITLKDWDDLNGNWISKVGFVDSIDIDLKEVFGDDIDNDLTKDSFMSVKDYDLFWGKRK